MKNEPDRRIFLIFYVSGIFQSTCYFDYRGIWQFRFFVHHRKATPLLRRLQKAGILMVATHESNAVREMQETDLGIKFVTMNTIPEVEREIDGSITFRFLDHMVGPFGAIFEVLYKGEKVSMGSLDFRGNPRPTLMKVLQRRGIRIVANNKTKRKLEDNGYDLGVEFDEEGRLF